MFDGFLVKKIVMTTATVSMFRVAVSVDIAVAADSQKSRSDETGSTRAMYALRFPTTSVRNAEVARTYLRQHKAAFAIQDVDAEFREGQQHTVQGGSHIRFQQIYMGTPVFRGEIIVSADQSGESGMLINNYKTGINLSHASETISSQSAIAAVRSSLPSEARMVGGKVIATRMVWQDEIGTYHFTFRVQLSTENPSGDWEAFVDEQSGEILHIENRFANHGSCEHVQGSGSVYLTDPLSAAKKRYGAPGFSDDNDRDSDSLNFYRSRVTLDSLAFENGVYKLKSPYCTVVDIECPVDPEYACADRDGFSFTRSQQEFEAVNVFYHISKSYQYIQSLGFSNDSLRAIRLDPHGLNGIDNSHYSPNGNWIAWGEGGVDDAEDVDAILHEYGHAIVFNFCPSWGGGESGALGEGYSDYWAASNSRRPKGWQPWQYEYNWVYNWNAHNMFQLGRSLNDTRTYPFGSLEIHEAGQIWSSALMSIWNQLGKEVTDRLVLKSLYYLGAAATGRDAAEALIQADRDLYGGTHVPTLVYWLGSVKHFIEVSTLADGGTEAVMPPAFSLDQNYPNPFNPSTTISFTLPERASASLCVYDLVGREVAQLASGVYNAGTFASRWNGTDARGHAVSSGVYFYVLYATAEDGREYLMKKRLTLVK